MKYLLLLFLFVGCGTISKHRCDNKVGIEKEQCIESYNNFVRHQDYMEFRGGRRDY